MKLALRKTPRTITVSRQTYRVAQSSSRRVKIRFQVCWCSKKSQDKHILFRGVQSVMLLWNVALAIDWSRQRFYGYRYRLSLLHHKSIRVTRLHYHWLPDYTGPAFFEGAERSTWVPLAPGTAEWHGQDGTTHFRKQLPISLAWALTTWKAQEMTCRGKVYAPFPSSERQAGLTYVNLSRLTEWSNLCIGKAIPLDRLTTKISSCKGMEERIAEDSRLRGLWDSTKAFITYVSAKRYHLAGWQRRSPAVKEWKSELQKTLVYGEVYGTLRKHFTILAISKTTVA